MLKLSLIAGLSSAALATLITWWAVSGHWEARYNGLQRDHSDAVALAEKRLRRQQEAAATAIAHIDAHYTTELTHAHTEIDSLRDDVAAGARRLRIQADCPDRVPGPAGAAGVDDGPGARLTRAAERNYWRLRERIETATQMIGALQEYAMECSGGSDPSG